MVETPCNVEPRRAVRFRLLWHGRGGRRNLPVARLGRGTGGGRGRGLLRRLRLRWLAARWLRRAARRLAAIYVAALSGPPAPPGASLCPQWIGVEPCFATPFVPTAAVGRPCW